MKQDQSAQRINKRNRKREGKRLFVSSVLLIVVMMFLSTSGVDLLSGHVQGRKPMLMPFQGLLSTPELLRSSADINGEVEVGFDLDINSANAILIPLGKPNEVLFDKKSTEKMYPASMTKIMTAIVVLESLDDLNETVVLSEDMFSYIHALNASVAGFLPNERVAAKDLLYGLLLPSGAECAIGLAEHVARDESAFVKLMNEKAQALGMRNTHFVNATGLHHKNHCSTAQDMAVLLDYALKDDTFYEIFTSAHHSTQPTNLHSGGITFYSTLFSKIESDDFCDGIVLGGKTGYTTEAGRCLASLAEKNGERFLLVTSGAPDNGKAKQKHIEDAFALYGAI